MAAGQLTFNFIGNAIGDYPAPLLAAVEALAERGDLEARGAVFTRIEVVELGRRIPNYD